MKDDIDVAERSINVTIIWYLIVSTGSSLVRVIIGCFVQSGCKATF